MKKIDSIAVLTLINLVLFTCTLFTALSINPVNYNRYRVEMLEEMKRITLNHTHQRHQDDKAILNGL